MSRAAVKLSLVTIIFLKAVQNRQQQHQRQKTLSPNHLKVKLKSLRILLTNHYRRLLTIVRRGELQSQRRLRMINPRTPVKYLRRNKEQHQQVLMEYSQRDNPLLPQLNLQKDSLRVHHHQQVQMDNQWPHILALMASQCLWDLMESL